MDFCIPFQEHSAAPEWDYVKTLNTVYKTSMNTSLSCVSVCIANILNRWVKTQLIFELISLTFFCRLLTRSNARLALYSPYTWKMTQSNTALVAKV